MARVFKHTYTKKDGNGKPIQHQTRKWYIEYRDANNELQRVPGFRDKKATMQRAAELERSAERQAAGVIDAESLDFAENLRLPIGTHVDAYERHLVVAGTTSKHLYETRRRLRRVVDDCSINRLADVQAERVRVWCAERLRKKMAPRTVNTYLASLRAFVRWCVRDRRMQNDPLAVLTRVDEKRGPRRARRALTEEEISRLLTATAARPLREAMTIRHGPRRGEHGAKVRDEVRNQLVLLGRERVLVYKTLILTGLRKSELANLRWSDLHLDEASPWLKVRAEIAKNARSAAIPLRSDLVDDLKDWKAFGEGERVFTVPTGIDRIFKRDLAAAGIPAKDADGRVVDVHALRHTTASYLASAGVPPRTAQALMRHSDIRLTLGTYSDPQLLDTAAALHALPKMDGEKPTETASAGGQKLGAQLGVFLGGTGSTDRHHVSSNGRQSLRKRQPKSNGKSGEEGTYDSRRHRLTPPAEKRAIGFEPTTSSLGST
jgi:integrase